MSPHAYEIKFLQGQGATPPQEAEARDIAAEFVLHMAKAGVLARCAWKVEPPCDAPVAGIVITAEAAGLSSAPLCAEHFAGA